MKGSGDAVENVLNIRKNIQGYFFPDVFSNVPLMSFAHTAAASKSAVRSQAWSSEVLAFS